MIMSRWPLFEGYERLKAAIGELRHQLRRLNEALDRRDDHFAAQLERTLRGE